MVKKGLEFLWGQMARFDEFKNRPNRLWAPKVLDPGAGDGVWGRVLREFYQPRLMVGVELRTVARPEGYDRWILGDFLDLPPMPAGTGFDLAIGNPPYREAEGFVVKSLDLLAPDGFLMFLLRLSFLESQRRGDGLFVEHPPLAVGVCKRRPSFTGNRKTSADAYMFCAWRKGHVGGTSLEWV